MRKICRGAVALLAAGWCAAAAGCQPTATLPQRSWSLVASGDTAGWIAPCGCTATQSGGLARRATYIEQLRKDQDVVVVDAGGAAGGASPYDEAKLAAILRGEVAMAIVAHNIGGSEAALGVDTLRRLAEETGAPLVSANLRDESGRLLFPPLRMAKVGDRRVAIVGVVAPQFAGPQMHAEEPAGAVLTTLATLKAKGGAKGRAADRGYDAAVVLAYLPSDQLDALAQALPEVDIVVGGPTHQPISPHAVGPTLLGSATGKGKFLAHFISPAAPGSAWTGEIVEMDDSLADDAGQIANLEKFRAELARREFTALETSFAPTLPEHVPSDYRIAGSAACAACHIEDCRIWNDSAHSTAWQTLLKNGAQDDSDCQHCHTTGFGLPGGFLSVRRSPERNSVGCESCHGPSQAHVAAATTRTPFAARDQCLRCHDRENSPEFAFDSYWKQIEHGPDQPTSGSRARSTPGEIPAQEESR